MLTWLLSELFACWILRCCVCAESLCPDFHCSSGRWTSPTYWFVIIDLFCCCAATPSSFVVHSFSPHSVFVVVRWRINSFWAASLAHSSPDNAHFAHLHAHETFLWPIQPVAPGMVFAGHQLPDCRAIKRSITGVVYHLTGGNGFCPASGIRPDSGVLSGNVGSFRRM